MSQKILIVDDEAKMRRVLQMALEADGFSVSQASDGDEALAAMKKVHFDLVITDLRMPGTDGLALLSEIRRVDTEVPVIVMTAYGTVETAVNAMRQGAFDYILKPFDMSQMRLVVKKALQVDRLIREHQYLQEEVTSRWHFEDMVGASAPMRQVFEQISQVAETKSIVLITGESGTGKELVARAIHARSPRRERPFVAVNCAALPETLLESELFGHVRGAFTGATSDRRGRFELADSGTLFLDEVASMSTALQGKLLRVLETHEFERVGGTQTISVDVRIVAATNRKLEEAVAAGQMREDLYYRLNVLPINLPPLRERRSDIPLLAEHFLKRFAAEYGKPAKELSQEALDALRRYDWPGNVRELENVIQRAVVLGKGEVIGPEQLPFHVQSAAAAPTTPATPPQTKGVPYQQAKQAVLEAFEREYFTHLIQSNDGNIARAAAEAGMDRKNLYQKLRRLGLDPNAFRNGSR